MIVAVRTTRGQELSVANQLAARTKLRNAKTVKAIVADPDHLRGYIIVETDNIPSLLSLLRGIRHMRQLVTGEMSLNELLPILCPTKTALSLSEGSEVEIVSGPLVGNRAIVKRVDKDKNEVSVELITSDFHGEIKMSAEYVRLTRR